MNDAPTPPAQPKWHVGAALAAWLLPGLGHVLLGQRKRGLVLGAAILGLFVSGLLIGGIDVIDSREDRLWYFGQNLAGPYAFVIDRVHQSMKADAIRRWQAETFRPPQPPVNLFGYTVSIGRVNELGTLYCTMAGFLNLLVIIDVIFRMDHARPRRPEPALRGRVITREGAGS